MPTSPPTVYTYKNCDTCRRATAWLRARGVGFVEKPIRETPPTERELHAMLAHLGGEVRRLCNTSGQDYRALGLKDRLPTMSPAEVVALLASNGNLVKRPFLLREPDGERGGGAGAALGLVGFDEAVWAAALG